MRDFGIPNPKRPGSELVQAVIQPTVSHLSEDKLREQVLKHCKACLNGCETPRIVSFVNSIPLTAAGKPDVMRLRMDAVAANAISGSGIKQS